MRNYIAIAEPSDDGTWWISFPNLPGVTSAADGPEQIAAQAQDALTSAVEAGAILPPAIEDGRDAARHMARFYALAVLAIGAGVELVAGCAQRPASPPAAPPHAATRVHPPDWFHQQLAAARAARRDHQPQTDTVGAQRAYDDVLRTACTQAALAGPGKYPARCDTVLRPTPTQPPTDPCAGDTDSQAMQTECSD